MPIDLNYYKKYCKIDKDNSVSNNSIVSKMTQAYNKQYRNSIRNFDVLINSDRADEVIINLDETNKIKALISLNKKITKATSSPLIYEIRTVPNTVDIGDYITVKNKFDDEKITYIILSQAEHRDGYDISYMQICNNFITLSKDLIMPCFVDSATLYTDGLNLMDKNITLPDDEITVFIQYNDITKKLKENQRVMFNHEDVFSITLFNKWSNMVNDGKRLKGMLKMHMERKQERNSLDDFENNLADNSHLKKEEPIILQIDNKTIQLEVNKTYQLNPKLFQGNKEIDSQEQLNKITYIVDDDSIVKVENGLITTIQKGNTNIQVCYDEQVINIPIQVTDISVHSGTCNIIGDDFIKIGKLSKWTVELYDFQGNRIDGKVEWDIVGDDMDELIKIREKTSNSIVLLAHKKQENIGKKFTIKCKTLDGLSFDQQEIILKSLI
ncbi:hypothetical protein [Clostridium botulinum]|uniref:hypothetical protein n=1 Tax=Clostridium botulinum TaxID=1491 RepID=UPI00174AF56D|nr:hypothetical protein [Clostridium botulinum]MBD5589189.1 hypothetical protein [Clostridium botulinum]